MTKAEWAAAVALPHRIATRVTLIDGVEQTALTGMVEGGVTLDSRAATRGRCDVTLVDDGALELVPTSATSPFAPYGNEIKLERGILLPDGTKQLAPLGVFRIDESTASEGGEGVSVRITGLDRSARIIDARFEEPYQVEVGTLYTTAILAVIQQAYPTVSHSFAASQLTTPTLTAEAGADRWAFAQSMATAMGMELYFNGLGVLVLRPVPTAVAGQAVASLVEGEGGVLLSADKRWTRQGAYNRVIATGENLGSAAPVRAVATDDNPASPTYYYGSFGKVPAFFASEFITTVAQAIDAAKAMLAKQLGTSRQISFGSVVNPALEPSDVVRVTRAKLAIDEDHVIDSLTIPLGADGAMSGATRATQVVA